MSLAPRNIRSRLALGYAIAVAVTVLVYASVVYAFTRSALLEQLDERLIDDAERAEHSFEVGPDLRMRWSHEEEPHGEEAETAWMEVIRLRDKAFLRRPEAPRGHRRERHAASQAAPGPFRVHEKDYERDGEAFLIRAGRSEVGVHQELRELLGLLALCLLPVVGLAWLGGLVLARRALRPVDVMTERARHIGMGRLSERLPVANPGDELGRLAAVFNEAFERIEASFERLRRFTSDAAHELRTPLTALRSVGEVGLKRSEDEAAYRDVISSMLEDTGRLTRLVEELLELSRGDARTRPIERVPVNVAELARSVSDQLEVLATEREQELVVEGDEETTVPADRASLRRAVMNLVDNAIRHGPPSSRVVVTVKGDPGAVVLAIQNEGPGIPPEHRARIFDRFYRVDPSRAGGNTGLGLSLAAQAVEAHGGRITLDDTDTGTTFRVTLARS